MATNGNGVREPGSFDCKWGTQRSAENYGFFRLGGLWPCSLRHCWAVALSEGSIHTIGPTFRRGMLAAKSKPARLTTA